MRRQTASPSTCSAIWPMRRCKRVRLARALPAQQVCAEVQEGPRDRGGVRGHFGRWSRDQYIAGGVGQVGRTGGNSPANHRGDGEAGSRGSVRPGRKELRRGATATAQAVVLLYRSLTGEARAIREARGSGYRALAWKRLEQALRLETPEKDLTELRREAGACLGDFVGLEPTDWQCPARTEFYSCDLHPGGELLAIILFGQTTSGQFTSEVLLRNVVTGQEIGRLRPERGPLICVQFSADGRRLFTGEVKGVVGVWQVDTAGNWHRANALTVAPQSSAFVTPFPLFPFFVVPRQSPPITQLAVSQDASLLAALSRSPLGGAISLWNLGDGKLAPPFHAAGAPSNWASMLHSVAFSPRGDLMAAGLAGGNLERRPRLGRGHSEAAPNPAARVRCGLPRRFQCGRQIPRMRLSRRTRSF